MQQLLRNWILFAAKLRFVSSASINKHYGISVYHTVCVSFSRCVVRTNTYSQKHTPRHIGAFELFLFLQVMFLNPVSNSSRCCCFTYKCACVCELTMLCVHVFLCIHKYILLSLFFYFVVAITSNRCYLLVIAICKEMAGCAAFSTHKIHISCTSKHW